MANTERIDELKRRVQMDPASIAFAALAEEYRREGRFEEAIATCSTGLRRHPSYLSAHVTLGRAWISLGRIDEARAEFEHVLRLAPENLAAIRALAEIHNATETAAEPRVVHEAGSVSPPLSSDAASLTTRNQASLALAVSIPQHTPSVPPALVGLEHFLDAIARARCADPNLVGAGAR
jgi:tetratricopeptide (TPR) repeat protein